ncbi:phage tail protein [Leuconostoc mesenteroides]|uniref:phage tail protein n=1 Tax=Leuconostoc mesenteroides TaxID=1245 RepID=UPI00235FD7D3|nr:phage tail protein [Leuconostoc mesenteroides]MDP0487044.1 phage tail protein [Leuconostoc mesenteroides]WMS38996.1 phage tail protein [Leuconostoc mesenteroides]
MSLGIAGAKLALVDKKGGVLTGANGIYKYTDKATSDKTGIFDVTVDNSYGVASVALTNLSGSTTDIFGNNKLVAKSAGKGNAQSVITINALPNEIKMAVLGMPSDSKGGFTITGKADPNNRVAFLAESAESFDINKPLYIGMYMGTASEASHTLTSNNTNDNRATDAITIAHLERGDDGFGKYFFSSAPKFDNSAMLADVFKTVVPGLGV